MLTRLLMRMIIAPLLVLALAATTWWFVAPVSIGGRTAMVVTSGSSMEPRLTANDMVIVRKADPASLRVGDIALYRSSSLNRFVLHRITAVRDDGRLTMRGDNNDFDDTDHPARADVVGKLAFVAPGAGKVPGVGSPITAAIMSMVIVALLLWSTIRRLMTRRAPKPAVTVFRDFRPDWEADSNTHIQTSPQSHTPRASRRRRMPALATIAAAAIAAATLGGSYAMWDHARGLPTAGVAARAAASSTESSSGGASSQLRHTGEFSYSGREPSKAIQPDQQVTTGDAVFTGSVRSLDMAFDYEMEGAGADSVSGTATYTLTVDDGSGWTMTQRLATSTVTAGATRLEAKLDLAQLRARLTAFERASGTEPPQYRLQLRPRIVLDAASSTIDKPLVYSPELYLVLDAVRLRPETITGGDVRTQFTPSEVVGTASEAAPSAPAAQARSIITRRVGYAMSAFILLIGFAISLMVALARRTPSVSSQARPLVEDRRSGPELVSVHHAGWERAGADDNADADTDADRSSSGRDAA